MAVIDNDQVIDRTEGILKIPQEKTILSQLGFFKERNVNSSTITFDVKENTISALSDKLRSTDNKNSMAQSGHDQHVLKLPYFPIETVISADSLGGLRAFDTDQGQKTVAAEVAEHLSQHVARHTYTHEYQKAVMLFRGQLVTDYHSTYDMAAEFGVNMGSATLSYMNPGDTNAQLRAAMNQSKAGLLSGSPSSFVMFAGNDLYDWLLTNNDVTEAMKMFGWSGANPLMMEFGSLGGYQSFSLGALTVVNYTDSYTLADGTQDQILPTAEGLLVPRTSNGLGRHYFGPENSMRGLSVGGQKYFAKQVRDPSGLDRFINMYSESSSLPVLESVGAAVKVDFTP